MGQGWAEREVSKRLSDGWSGDALCMGRAEATDMLTKAHARAVRIVKRHLKMVMLDRHVFTAPTRKYLIAMLREVLADLQKGRA